MLDGTRTSTARTARATSLQCTHERAIDGQACLRLKGTVLNGFFKGVNARPASLRMVK